MGSEWYSVHMEARASADALNLMVDEDAADALMDLLDDHDGAVSTGTGVWEATISVRAVNAWEATSSGSVLIEKLADKAGIPDWPAVRVDVVRQDVLEAENMRPTLPELVSGPEAAEILGVSPQRLRQLADGHASFPEPMYELRAGKLWLKDAIEAFDRRWDRKPGRPRRSLHHVDAESKADPHDRWPSIGSPRSRGHQLAVPTGVTRGPGIRRNCVRAR